MRQPDTLDLQLTTPENVPLPFEIASVSHRLFALIIDLMVMGVILLGVWLLAIMVLAVTGVSGGGAMLLAFVMVVSFFVRNFYFAFSELRWHGQTLGKRKLGLRVIARDGGPLTAEMVFARNLTRDLEIFLPAIALYAPEALFAGAPDWARLACGAWIFILALLPAFNKHRARLGDLVGGTVVVVQPAGMLLPDLVSHTQARQRAGQGPDFHFTRQQLEIYGIKELQVLEQVLRRDVVPQELIADIAERIKRKIDWDERKWNVPPERFLRAFYAQQRSRLEQKMLFGKRQEKKTH